MQHKTNPSLEKSDWFNGSESLEKKEKERYNYTISKELYKDKIERKTND